MANSTSSTPAHSHIYYHHQSQSISFADWITLFTLCLAPLLTHVAFGYANPVILSDYRPRWRDRLPQFNPITIIWRWYAIVNRRTRAVDWDRADMAATNAIFWDGYRWEGSEEIMAQSRDWITKQPEYSRVNWVSSSTLATVAMTLQGVAAVIRLRAASSKDWRSATSGLPDIFFPMAVLSFVRLPASPWLSKDYSFERTDKSDQLYHTETLDLHSDRPDPPSKEERLPTPPPITYSSNNIFASPTPFTTSITTATITATASNTITASPETLPELSSHPPYPRLYPPTFKTHLWTTLTISLTLLLSAAGIYVSTSHLGPAPGVVVTQLSSFLTSLFYLCLSISGAAIIVYYTLKGHAGDTVLPCLNSRWFRVWNVVLMALALAMFVATALETKIVNGVATTYEIPLSA